MAIFNFFSILPASPLSKTTRSSTLLTLGLVMSLSTGLANVSLKYNRWESTILFSLIYCFLTFWLLISILQCGLLSDGKDCCNSVNCTSWIYIIWKKSFFLEGKTTSFYILSTFFRHTDSRGSCHDLPIGYYSIINCRKEISVIPWSFVLSTLSETNFTKISKND